ncbi:MULTISPECIES: hypothetical protein [Bacillus cereus group]|uniref:hypothetical protein n=1 Tax=Bacillus cereus group TaxID=86661 RepID=UPI000BEC482D|nr:MULTISPECIES: hypothetical protein [Bacillus cereus group]MEC2258670.1 hypothetical protein [Bacillus cereus]PEB73487.1 hypothetical protein COM89_22110 [Bacillus thuringiensis]PFB81797.1 hypothetical protein CN283_23120 [Bacillus thuringiensis]PFN09808.1 hypothetical protein COJ51_07015 [Bacillus thuringiensis]PGM12720.1 hypothetical protein CN938_14600 [Bacillus thuringiensis]
MNKYVAELNFEYKDGDFQIPLTDIQLQAIFKILGMKIDTEEQSVSAYGEKMLIRFMSEKYQNNPFHYKISNKPEILDER